MVRDDLLSAADLDEAAAGPLFAGLVQNRYLRATAGAEGVGYELTPEGQSFAEARGLVVAAPTTPSITPPIKPPRVRSKPSAALMGAIGRVEPGAAGVSDDTRGEAAADGADGDEGVVAAGGVIPADSTEAVPADASSGAGGRRPICLTSTNGQSINSIFVEALIYDLDHIMDILITRGEVVGDKLGIVDAGGCSDQDLAWGVKAKAAQAMPGSIAQPHLIRCIALALLDPSADVRSAAAGVCRPYLGDMDVLGAAVEVAGSDPERDVVADLLIAIAGDGAGDDVPEAAAAVADPEAGQVVIAIAATRHPIPIIRLLALTIIAGWPEPWRHVAHMTHDADGDIAMAAWMLFDLPGASAAVMDAYVAGIDRRLANGGPLPVYDLANAERSGKRPVTPTQKNTRKPPPRRIPTESECHLIAMQNTEPRWVTNSWASYLLIGDDPATAIGYMGKRPPTPQELNKLKKPGLQDQICVGKPVDAISLFWYLATIITFTDKHPDRYRTSQKVLEKLKNDGI